MSIFKTILLTVLLCISAAASAAYNGLAVKYMPALGKMLDKTYKISSVSAEKIPGTANQAERIVISGHPLKGILDPDQYKTVLAKPEYADILLVPANSDFRIDKAIRESEPKTDPATADFFFQQFGFPWRKLENGLKYQTVYLGKNDEFYCFASSNMEFLVRLQAVFQLKNGADPVALLVEGLSVQDAGNITSYSAAYLLPAYKNKSLPLMPRSIREINSIDEPAAPQFQVLSLIKTPEADAMLNRYASANDSDFKLILKPLFDAIRRNNRREITLEPCFRRMLREQYAVDYACAVFNENNRRDAVKPELYQIEENPKSYVVYSTIIRIQEEWHTPDTVQYYDKAEKSIRMLLVHSNDMPEGLVFRDVKKTEAEMEMELRKEDEKRVYPYFGALLTAPSHRMTMLVGLNLALTTDESVPRTAVRYAARIRYAGAFLLRCMKPQQKEIEHAIRTLITHSQNKKEVELLKDLAKQLNIAVY